MRAVRLREKKLKEQLAETKEKLIPEAQKEKDEATTAFSLAQEAERLVNEPLSKKRKLPQSLKDGRKKKNKAEKRCEALADKVPALEAKLAGLPQKLERLMKAVTDARDLQAHRLGVGRQLAGEDADLVQEDVATATGGLWTTPVSGDGDDGDEEEEVAGESDNDDIEGATGDEEDLEEDMAGGLDGGDENG